jgi:hypothetical protein
MLILIGIPTRAFMQSVADQIQIIESSPDDNLISQGSQAPTESILMVIFITIYEEVEHGVDFQKNRMITPLKIQKIVFHHFFSVIKTDIPPPMQPPSDFISMLS